MKILLGILLFICCTISAQVTFIPDPEFESYLINEGIDTDGIINGQVLTADIEDELLLMIGPNPQLNDLTGIEGFASLEELYLYQVDVSELNLSQNLALTQLSMDDMSLNSLDITNNENLTYISLSLNSPTDMFSGNIDEIDLSQNVLLETINIGDSFLEINLSNNPNIEFIELKNSQDLIFVNLLNGNNEGILFLDIRDNPNLQCIQVDDPQAVIEGVIPPYNDWFIDIDPPQISDNCVLGNSDYNLLYFKIFPNPASNLLTIQNQNGLDIDSVVLYDTLGRKVMENTESTEAIDVSNLTTGVYFIHIATNQGIVTKKIIKE